MKNVYPVYFTKADNIVLVEVPDFEILTEGKDMIDAIEHAKDAIELKCVTMEDAREEIPEPTDISQLDVTVGTFAQNGTTIISLVIIDSVKYRKKMDLKTVRKNVTLPSWLNYEAEKAGVNVSRILQDALIEQLGVQRK